VRARVLEVAGLESALHDEALIDFNQKRSGRLVHFFLSCQYACTWRRAFRTRRLSGPVAIHHEKFST
jgi:hypothetical protein